MVAISIHLEGEIQICRRKKETNAMEQEIKTCLMLSPPCTGQERDGEHAWLLTSNPYYSLFAQPLVDLVLLQQLCTEELLPFTPTLRVKSTLRGVLFTIDVKIARHSFLWIDTHSFS